MGRRELLIIAAFVAIGVVAFELTAPPAPEGRGFSFSRLWQNARTGIRGNHAVASTTITGNVAVGAAVTEIRVSGLNRGVHIVGEDRQDVSYDLEVESDGPDEATALAAAKKTTIKQDDLGPSLALAVTFPREYNQWGAIILHVPARMAVRVSGSGGADLSNVTSVNLDQISGSVSIHDIPGAATGGHRSGDLTVTNVGSLDLTLVGSRAKITDVKGAISLNARGGRTEIIGARGEIQIDQSSQETTIRSPAGPVRITGTGGRVTVEHPKQDVKVDCRRTEIEVSLDAAVAATLLTTDEALRLILDGPPGVNVDAIATDDGAIHGEDFALAVTKSSDNEQRVSKSFGGAAAPRVTLRTARGSIVIRKAK